MLIVVERRETFHYYYPMGVHPPGDLTVTSHGLSVTLALGPDRALILADLPDSFVAVTILAGSADGLTRDLLEELADSFDLSKLTPIVLPDSLYIPSP